MKRTKFLALGFAALMGALSLNSCKDDAAVTLAPVVTFTVAGSQVTTVNVADGELVSYELRVKAAGEIKSITIYEGTSESDRTQKGTAKTADFLQDTMDLASYTVTASATVTKVFVVVVDKKDQTTNATLSLVIGGAAGQINTWTGKILGCGANTTLGSYFSTSTGLVYLSAAAKTNIAVVDIVYDNTTSPFLGSPSESALTVTGKKITNFGTSTVTGTEFDAMTDDASIKVLTAPTALKVDAIAQGSVYVFKTAEGKLGLIKVTTAPTSGATGTVTIDVKVQK